MTEKVQKIPVRNTLDRILKVEYNRSNEIKGGPIR